MADDLVQRRQALGAIRADIQFLLDDLLAALAQRDATIATLTRERDALNAAAIDIVREYGPPSEYDQPYRGMWLALQYAIRREGA